MEFLPTNLICNNHFSNSSNQLSLSQLPSMMKLLPMYLICNIHFHFSNSTKQLSLFQFSSMVEFLPTYLICTNHFHFSNSTEQLSLSQFPSMMEFLPTYLINVWDSALTPVFHTFLFDCDHDRALALQVCRGKLSLKVQSTNWRFL